MSEPIALTPGAPRAKRLGCLCPVIDNHHGLGYGRSKNGPLYVIRCDCPLHGDEAEERAKEEKP